MQETQIWSLSQKDPLEEGMETNSSILAWRVPWTEESGGLQSIASVEKTRRCNSAGMHQSVQWLSHIWLFATPWTAAHPASLSITNSQSLLKLMSIEPVMPSGHLMLCHPLLLLPSIFPSIRVFSNESVLRIRWPKHWSYFIRGSIYQSSCAAGGK